MAFGELYSSLGSYRAIDNWVQAMSSSVAGAGKIGFKANRSTFLGGSTYQNINPSRGVSYRAGEQTLYSETTVDWSQGDIIDSETANNFAINGEGFFLVMDDDRNFYYTRGGDFTIQNGKLKTPQGLTVIDKTILETMTRQLGAAALPSNISTVGVATAVSPNYTGAALTATDLFTTTSPWVKPGGTGASMWLPFINNASSATSQYYEDPNGTPLSGDESYKAMGISLKTSFYVAPSQGIDQTTMSRLSVVADNVAFVWINGHQLSISDLDPGATSPITSENPWGGYPVADGPNTASTSVFDIGKYLSEGVNTIQLYAAEWEGTQGTDASGVIQLASGGSITIASGVGNNSQWTTKLIGPDLDKDYYLPAATGAPFTPLLGRHPSPPTQTYEDCMFNAEARDFVLAMMDFKEGLRFS
ncbi:MAG: hypothetical protein H7338_16160 [Candidatus Sericytochromatia bacterium]|nr:hypothetical protein [Candidatus Sericytochromatia bacterium]